MGRCLHFGIGDEDAKAEGEEAGDDAANIAEVLNETASDKHCLPQQESTDRNVKEAKIYAFEDATLRQKGS